MHEIYKNIKKYRKTYGWTQTELAEKVGYADKGMISRIENGKVDLQQSQVIRFAEVFGIAPGELMGSEGTIPAMSVGDYYGLPEFTLSDEEKQIVRKYRTLSDSEKDMVCKMLDVQRKDARALRA